MRGGTFNGAPATLPVLPRPAPRTLFWLGRFLRPVCVGAVEGWEGSLTERGRCEARWWVATSSARQPSLPIVSRRRDASCTAHSALARFRRVFSRRMLSIACALWRGKGTAVFCGTANRGGWAGEGILSRDPATSPAPPLNRPSTAQAPVPNQGPAFGSRRWPKVRTCSSSLCVPVLVALIYLYSAQIMSSPAYFCQMVRVALFTALYLYLISSVQATTSVNGCTCNGSCRTTADSLTSAWCYTSNNCGSYSILRGAYYDYCHACGDGAYT